LPTKTQSNRFINPNKACFKIILPTKQVFNNKNNLSALLVIFDPRKMPFFTSLDVCKAQPLI
jgi:hypothetical protein